MAELEMTREERKAKKQADEMAVLDRMQEIAIADGWDTGSIEYMALPIMWNDVGARKFWSSSEWEKMRHQTVAVLNSLVPRTPELKDKLQFSCHLTRLSDMVTVGLPEFRRRRSYKDGRVSKLNVALLRKRLRSIHERNQSDYPMLQAEAAASNQGNHVVQASNPDRNCSKEASNLLDSMHCLKKNLKPSKVAIWTRCDYESMDCNDQRLKAVEPKNY
ncbi:hypothetical protein EJB05_35984, partial [Eragrostis curvula]